jgi:hypothetical protein
VALPSHQHLDPTFLTKSEVSFSTTIKLSATIRQQMSSFHNIPMDLRPTQRFPLDTATSGQIPGVAIHAASTASMTRVCSFIHLNLLAQRSICNADYLDAARMYYAMVQDARESMAQTISQDSSLATSQRTNLLRIKLRPRHPELRQPTRHKPVIPYNALELHDFFYAFEAAETYGECHACTDSCDELIYYDRTSSELIASIALYNLAMSFLWHDACTTRTKVGALRSCSVAMRRALRMFQILSMLPSQANLLCETPTQFQNLRTSLALASVNNSAYIHSILHDVPAVETSLAQLNEMIDELLYRDSIQVNASCSTMLPLHDYHRTLIPVCLMNLYLLFHTSVSTAPIA